MSFPVGARNWPESSERAIHSLRHWTISLALGTKVFKGEGRKLSFWVLWLVLEERDSDFSNLPWWVGRERDRKIGESQKFCIWALANLTWKYQHYKRLLCLSTNTRMFCEWYLIKCSFCYNSFDLEKMLLNIIILMPNTVLLNSIHPAKSTYHSLFTHSLVSGYMVYLNFHYYESHIKYLCMGLGKDIHFSFTSSKQPEWAWCIILF